MARKAIVALCLLTAAALSGCIQMESHQSYEQPNDCWMWCDSSVEFSGFFWFPMMIMLLVMVGVIVAVVIAVNSNPPQQQQVVIKTESKDED